MERKLKNQDWGRSSRILCALGSAEIETDNLELAANQLEDGIAILTKESKETSPEYLDLIEAIGVLQIRLGHLKDAQSMYENGLHLAKQLYGENHLKTAAMYQQLSHVLVWQGNYINAEVFARKAIKIYGELLPDRHPARVYADLNLGIILFFLEKSDESERILTQALTDQKKLYGTDNAILVNTYGFLSDAQLQSNHLQEAEKSARTSLYLAKKHLRNDKSYLGSAHTTLANILLKRKKYSAAEVEGRAALLVLQSPSEEKNLYTASAQYVLADVLSTKGDLKEAEVLLRGNLVLLDKIEAPQWRIARSQSLLGAVLLKLNKFDEAFRLLKSADEVLSAKDSGTPTAESVASKYRLEQARELMRTQASLKLQNRQK